MKTSVRGEKTSIAGIHSYWGDAFQTLVALDWALTLLTDPRLQQIEIDSTSFKIDDVVIGRSDGSGMCCQYKKNNGISRAVR